MKDEVALELSLVHFPLHASYTLSCEERPKVKKEENKQFVDVVLVFVVKEHRNRKQAKKSEIHTNSIHSTTNGNAESHKIIVRIKDGVIPYRLEEQQVQFQQNSQQMSQLK